MSQFQPIQQTPHSFQNYQQSQFQLQGKRGGKPKEVPGEMEHTRDEVEECKMHDFTNYDGTPLPQESKSQQLNKTEYTCECGS